MKNIKIGKALEIYPISQGIAVDAYIFGYRIRWYSNPHFFSIQNTRGWAKI